MTVFHTFLEDSVDEFLYALRVDFWEGPTGSLHGICKEDNGAFLELWLGSGIAISGFVNSIIIAITVAIGFGISVFSFFFLLGLVVEVVNQTCAVVLANDVDNESW